MREIKFRGKCIKGRKAGQFVYGDLLRFDGGKTSIRTYDADGVYTLLYAVDPATVGQFTGLRDAKGVEIYEGDVLLSAGMRGTVVYERGCFWLERPLYNGNSEIFPLYAIDCKIFKVAGNIHDTKGDNANAERD